MALVIKSPYFFFLRQLVPQLIINFYLKLLKSQTALTPSPLPAGEGAGIAIFIALLEVLEQLVHQALEKIRRTALMENKNNK
jgi:hypothetical protein